MKKLIVTERVTIGKFSIKRGYILTGFKEVIYFTADSTADESSTKTTLPGLIYNIFLQLNIQHPPVK
jgi:hypothetical protein